MTDFTTILLFLLHINFHYVTTSTLLAHYCTRTRIVMLWGLNRAERLPCVGPFISDMQLKVFVTKVVEPNVFVLNVNLHRIHVLALALTWMKTSEVQSIQLHGIDIKTSEVQSIQMLGIDIKTELSGSKPAINRL